MKCEFGEDDVGAVSTDGFGFGGERDDPGAVVELDFGTGIAVEGCSGGDGIVFDVELEVVGPFFGFFEGFDGLAFTGGNNQPVGFRMADAIKNRFGGAGEVLAGLASPEADFEAGVVRCKSGLVGEEFKYCGFRIGDCGFHKNFEQKLTKATKN
jgi:hypothetical protein